LSFFSFLLLNSTTNLKKKTFNFKIISGLQKVANIKWSFHSPLSRFLKS
jgi:hypothetical protein